MPFAVQGLARAGKGTLMRFGLAMLVMAAVAGCAPDVPDSGAGFQSYPDYVREREAGLAGTVPAPVIQPSGLAGPAVSTQPLDGTGVAGAVPGPENRDSIPAGIAPQIGEMANVAPVDSAAISDEQDFTAVSARETIESNAARISQQRSQYTVIAPTALPTRTGPTGPNIVEYALSTTNAVGESIYSRNNPFREKQSVTNCAKFPASDLAQADFLSRGGPENDSRSLDPDGDGFACYWDPAPFRTAVN